MSVSPSSSTQAAREALAARLGELRREAELSGHELAVRCGWSLRRRPGSSGPELPPPMPTSVRGARRAGPRSRCPIWSRRTVMQSRCTCTGKNCTGTGCAGHRRKWFPCTRTPGISGCTARTCTGNAPDGGVRDSPALHHRRIPRHPGRLGFRRGLACRALTGGFPGRPSFRSAGGGRRAAPPHR